MKPSVGAVQRSALGLLVVLALATVPATVAFAQEASTPPQAERATSLEVSFQASEGKGIPHYLVARLTTEDGSSVSGERVRFVRQADIFGGRSVELGRPRTDNAGIARIAVVPREPTYELKVTYSGSEDLEAAEVATDMAFPEELVVRTARPPHGGGLVDPHLSPLASVMPGVIGTAVLIVWVVLLVVGLGAVWQIRRETKGAGSLPPDSGTGTPGSRPADT